MKKFLSLFCLIAIAWLCNSAYAGVYKTLTFPDENKANNKVQSYTATWSAKIGTDEWSIENFNNNNWNWSSIKCGRKSDASTASIATNFAVDKAISDVVVTIPSIKNTKKIKSITMLVASNKDFSPIDETVKVSIPTAACDLTFKVANPAKNKYYKIIFDMDVMGANGCIEISKVVYNSVEEPDTELTAPTVSLAAGTYYEKKTLTITAPEGATLEGTLNGETISGTSFSKTLELVAGETKKYELRVAAKKDDVSSDIVEAVYTIDGQVVDAEVTGNIVIADQKDHNTTGASVSTLTLIDNNGQTFTLTRTDGSNSSYMAIYDDGLRMYKNNTYELKSDMLMTKVKFTASAYDLGNSDSENWSSPETKTFVCKAGMNKFTFNSGTSSTSKIQSIEITYKGKMHYDKVGDGKALIGMKKGKFYKVNVVLQGVKADDGVLYARTSAKSAAPSEPRQAHIDHGYDSYEDINKLGNYDQRDWVAINGLTSDYEGKEVVTGFIASYDGEKLTPVADPAIGSPLDVELNTFGVANVFYGGYTNTLSLGWKDAEGNPYEPFFVKAKVNEVANYAGTLSKESASEGSAYRLTGSGVCGVFEDKGVLLEPASEAIRAALDAKLGQYQIVEGVLLTETSNTLANGDVKIVALAGPADAPTGVAALKADGKATIYGTEGAVVVNGADGKVMIFDAMGRMVKSVNAEGAATVAMPAGYYIVRTAGTAAKVMVK